MSEHRCTVCSMTDEEVAAIQAAISELGATLLSIYCGEHKGEKTPPRKPVGEVRRSSLGPLLVFGREETPPGAIERKRQREALGGPRIPNFALRVIHTDSYLIDSPARGQQPEVFCPRCGQYAIDLNELVDATAEALRTKPGKLIARRRSAVLA